MAQASWSDRGMLTASPTDQMGVQSKCGYTVLPDHGKDAAHDHAVNMHALAEPSADVIGKFMTRLYPGPSLHDGLQQTLRRAAVMLLLAVVCSLLGALISQLLFASAPSWPTEQFRQETVAEITRKLEERFHLQDLAQVQERLTGIETRLQALEEREATGNRDRVASGAERAHEALESRLQELEERVQNLHQLPGDDDDLTDVEAGDDKDDDEIPLDSIMGDYPPLKQMIGNHGIMDKTDNGEELLERRFRRSPTEKGNGKKKGGTKTTEKPNTGKVDKKFCKKVSTCGSGVSFVPKAVHFMSDFWGDGSRKEKFGKEQPLKFLKPAGWMKDIYKKPADQPITSDNGVFTVNQSGLYLIYSSVMFHDNKPRQSQAVVVDGQKLFKCMDSVDYIDTDLPPENNQAKYKTCAMTGVTHLKAGQKLEVQNLYANTEIDLSTDATYFGAVLLNPGETKSTS